LWILTGIVVANNAQLPLGFTPEGQLPIKVPCEQILLLPVLATLVLITDLVIGFFFFRREEAKLTAYLLWLGGIITPCLLLISIILTSLAV
ncbi:MAG: hypothetical protein CVU46_15535, partial [Chloroflexi bacterium HGW-Chloroflexi-8]